MSELREACRTKQDKTLCVIVFVRRILHKYNYKDRGGDSLESTRPSKIYDPTWGGSVRVKVLEGSLDVPLSSRHGHTTTNLVFLFQQIKGLSVT